MASLEKCCDDAWPGLMRWIALVIGVLVLVVGMTGVLSPDTLVPLARQLVTPSGFPATAAVQVIIGVVLILAAASSRAPMGMRLLGVAIIALGIATARTDIERARQILNGWTSNGPPAVRLGSAAVAAFGALFVILVAPGVRKYRRRT
uniref:Uncharacterized protein n=1 Tax=uncultured bacterium 98 TaxID=698395 RepID=E3T6K3_9BACT|nr:hypothetical protein [uncultured bacterium 98]